MRLGSAHRGAAAGLLAAILFGASAPVAKRLIPEAGPLLLASLLYLGAGLALLPIRRRSPEARLRRGDAAPLAGIVVLGGLAGPVLMLVGLARVSGVAGSLLLNLEAPLTMLLAVAVFGEHLGRLGAVGAALVVAGGAVLALRPGELHADPWGALAIAGACLCWGIDNNLSQRLSLRDPVRLARWKTLAAGAGNLGIALALGTTAPRPAIVGAALVVGAFGYGVSIVLDLIALRLLGAAREAAYFATAPFIGAVVAIPVLGERAGGATALAGALMAAGVVALLRERHAHEHTHEPLEHDHAHVHDEHHQHDHDGPTNEPHAHPHRHERLTHSHPHVADLHHRHKH